MAKKKPLSLSKKIVIVGGALALIQGGLLIYWKSQSQVLTTKDSINEAVSKAKVPDERRKEMLRVQAAVKAYQIENKKLPDNLSQLVPVYFDFIPIDSNTGKPFDYKVEGTRFFVGDAGNIKTAKGSTTGNKLDEATLSEEDQKKLIDSISQEDPEDKNYVYDATGKRDPFLPFDLRPTNNEDPNLPPLQRITVGQLKLTATLAGLEDPSAIVETQTGKGFTIKKGTKIGTENGVVVDILQDKVVIVEEMTDFTGKKKSRTIELKLRTVEDNSTFSSVGGNSKSSKSSKRK